MDAILAGSLIASTLRVATPLILCALAGLITPRPPECSGLPPSKKRFGDATQLSNAEGPGQYHVDPTAYLSPAGELTVVYTAGGDAGKPSSLGALASGQKGGVFDLGEIKAQSANAAQPRLVADRTGKLYLFWMGYDGRFSPPQKLQIMMSTSADGKTWSKPISAVNASQICCHRSSASSPSSACSDSEQCHTCWSGTLRPNACATSIGAIRSAVSGRTSTERLSRMPAACWSTAASSPRSWAAAARPVTPTEAVSSSRETWAERVAARAAAPLNRPFMRRTLGSPG